jgi:dipeptidyl aminopeptidase/acylaminoacyl peptidase
MMGIQLMANSEKITAPYGSWKSPITAEKVASSAVHIEKGKEWNGAVILSEVRPLEKGRTALQRIVGGKFEDLLPEPFNARTTVHEYGGGSYFVDGDCIYFSNFSDQQLYRRDADGKISQLTFEPNCRFADGCRVGDFLIYVMEEHGEEVENCLVAIDSKGKVKKIESGADFYSRPRVSPDGKKLAFYSWNHPNMPWDGGELKVREFKPDGTLGKTEVIAGSENESICTHDWGPDGKLYYISDISGWWNLYESGKAICPMEADIGFPQWVFGESYFAFWGKDKIVCVYTEAGEDFLAYLEKGNLKKIDIPFQTIWNLSISHDDLYFMGSSPQIPPSLVKLDLKTGHWSTIKKNQELFASLDYFSGAEKIEFPTENGLTAHAFYYPPKNPDYKAPEKELPPLLVLSHGGPTGHSQLYFNLEIQYWTSRGFAVVDVNYGGSSGYGRAYRQRLDGAWGVVDVDDCTNAAKYCASKGLADPNRLSIAGGSAGGYTTLACLAFKDVFKAGASYFGVSDLEALVKDTHKFEARYLDRLIAPYPEGKKIYTERSPIHSIETIRCPAIFLQGDEDKIVPPNQSEMMYESLLKRGIPTAYLLFEKEQHGFRQAPNIQRALEAHFYFFSKVFGFEPADRIEPIEIDNL